MKKYKHHGYLIIYQLCTDGVNKKMMYYVPELDSCYVTLKQAKSRIDYIAK